MSFPPTTEKTPLHINMTLEAGGLGQFAPLKAVTNPFYEAVELDKVGQHKQAEKIYNTLLNADFDNPILLAALGMNLATQERNGLASHLLRRALTDIDGMLPGFKRLGIVPKGTDAASNDKFAATKRAEVLNALGTCYKHENITDQARIHFIEAQAGIPLNADIQNNLATLYINEGKPEKALEHLDLAIGLQADHPQAKWNRSLAHLELGNYEKGWDEYDAGFAAKVRNERNYTPTPLPLWDGSPGNVIALFGEQGIGDEIMFASCIPDLLKVSKQVVFDCHKKLHRLFADTWPELDIYPTREDEVLTWPMTAAGVPRYPFDCRVAIGSLPKFFRPTLLSFPGTPFIKPNVAAEAEWAVKLAKLGPRPKIGISWIGGHKRTRVEVRSIALERWLPILKDRDADFISLQYTDCAHEIAEFEAKHGIKIHQFPEAINSPHYADTAALVANLDLVISVATSVNHLAGSMGVPCWVLTASRAAWREYYGGDTNPWYKAWTMFRQEQGSIDWNPVIDDVAQSLKTLLDMKNA